MHVHTTAHIMPTHCTPGGSPLAYKVWTDNATIWGHEYRITAHDGLMYVTVYRRHHLDRGNADELIEVGELIVDEIARPEEDEQEAS